MRRSLAVSLTTVLCACAAGVLTTGPRPRTDALIVRYPGRVARLPDSVQRRFNLDTAFYAKYASADGIPVISSALVPDAALLVARDIIRHMLSKRPDVRADIIQRGGRVGVMAVTEMTTEFSHSIHASVRRVDSTLQKELEAAYKEATDRKMYINARGGRHYAVNTIAEYWAEGTQWWFWSNYPEVFVTDGVEQPVWSPEDLQKYDPKLFAILAKVYPDHHIPADVYHGKKLRPSPARAGGSGA